MHLSILLLLACAYAGDAYKVLVVFPIPGRSHAILGDGVVRHLAAAGHDVTFITAVVQKNAPKNVRQLDVSENFDHLPQEKLNLKSLMNKETEMSMSFLFEFILKIQNVTYHNPNVQEILMDPNEQFDVVVAEWMFSELYAGFAAIFNVPLIWVSTIEPHWMVLRLIDEPSSPAYTTDSMSSSIPPFTFAQRVIELFKQVAVTTLKKLVVNRYENEVYLGLTPFFKVRGLEPPPYADLLFNASLMLGNSHVSMGQATPLPQSYKPIGGYHINTKVAPLPEDLQKILDNAKHGVIYFSLGSNVKSKDMPEELKTSLLKMFSGLKQTVIWKFEEAFPGVPKNVHIVHWAPQPSILAHPNCVLFITHGGLLSTTETIHFAKPIIGLPVFADQFTNVNRAVAKGFAKRVDLSVNMADDLKLAIEEIIVDPKYTNKVKELSFIYHDRPVTPGKELVHWVEHVIKTNGAPHLRSPALAVPFYQKMYLDLLALILAVVLSIRAIFRMIFKKKSSKKQKTQ